MRPPTPVLVTLGGIVGLLVVATLAVHWLKARHPEKDFEELRLRVRTWWFMSGVFGLALLLNRAVSLVFFAFLSFLALKEYLSLIPTRRADRRVLFWAYLAIPLQYWWIHESWYGMFIIFIPVYLFFLLPIRMILIGETEGFLKAVGTLHWGLMTTVFTLSHAAYLLVLQDPDLPGSVPGPGLLLYLVLLTQLGDVAQYFWGKLLGRRKVVPRVSPGKTWAGLVGGVCTTTVLGAVLGPLLTPLHAWQATLAGAVIGVAGFFGDLMISALKRDLGVKDTGTSLPGHGGILDRVDSMTCTAPLFFHLVYYLHF